MVGLQKAGTIIAINDNPNPRRSPIIAASDFTIIGDWQEYLPPLVEALKPVVSIIGDPSVGLGLGRPLPLRFPSETNGQGVGAPHAGPMPGAASTALYYCRPRSFVDCCGGRNPGRSVAGIEGGS